MIRMTELVEQVGEWLKICFGRKVAEDKIERTDRFIEEALELAQTTPGWGKERAYTLVEYVFGRPVGQPHQEVGGVMITLSALCYARGINLENAALNELSRINRPATMDKIRTKQASKDQIQFDDPASAVPIGSDRQEKIKCAEMLCELAEHLLDSDIHQNEQQGVWYAIGYIRARAYSMFLEAGEHDRAKFIEDVWRRQGMEN